MSQGALWEDYASYRAHLGNGGPSADVYLGNRVPRLYGNGEQELKYCAARSDSCAGAALTIDVLFDGAHLLDCYRLWNHHISWVVIVTAAGLLAIAGVFF